MRDEFSQYLQTIGTSTVVRERIEGIHEFYKGICPEEITGIFVTDYIKADGVREFDSLWFFSRKYAMEAKQFLSEDDFDIATFDKSIERMAIKKQDYDFKQATEKSRLNVNVYTASDLNGDLKASKENCDYLREVTLTYLLPNLK